MTTVGVLRNWLTWWSGNPVRRCADSWTPGHYQAIRWRIGSQCRTSRSVSEMPSKLQAYRPIGWPQNWHIFVRLITSSNIDQFSNRFYCQNQEKICNVTITKDPTTPQICRYTTLWNIGVFKATIDNKTTFVTTHFKSASSSSKAGTINNWGKNCKMRQLL